MLASLMLCLFAEALVKLNKLKSIFKFVIY